MLASSLTLVTAAVSLLAADPKPVPPVINVQEVETDDATTYAMWVARSNEVAKAKLGVDRYIRVYVAQTAGEESGAVFAVSGADSFATMQKNMAAMSDAPELNENRTSMPRIRTLGAARSMKAVRYDGSHPGAFLYNTQAVVNDEAGYLKALDGLRALFDANGLKDARINCYRVVAGRDDFTHLISINLPSAESRAVLLDAAASAPWLAEWIAGSAKYRTVVRNGTYREITR